MSEEKIKTNLKLDSDICQTPKTVPVHYSQTCLLCENAREIAHPMWASSPWICDECKEAIVFLKDFMKSCDKAKEMLNEMENPSENIYPL